MTEEQEVLIQGLRDVLTKEFDVEYYKKLDDEKRWPYEVMAKLGELGYLGLSVPEEYGGYGGNSMDVTLAIEESARIMGGPAMAFFTQVCFGTRAIAEFGTEKQKEEMLPGLMDGSKYCALAVTEPDGGTDMLGAMKTSARADGNGNWVINGSKIFITGAHIAEWIIVVLRTSGFEEKRTKGVSMFIVPAKAKGLTIEPVEVFCHGATGANLLTFDNVVVPEENLFGPMDRGLYTLFGVLNDERIGAAAMSLGLAECAFDEALAYAKQRMAFGKPLGQFQAVQHMLANCWTTIQAGKYLLYKAAWLEANHLDAAMESNAAKLYCSDNAVKIINDCMDVLGGYQVTREFRAFYLFRDSRFTFAPVANNAARNMIGESLGLPKSY